jgi:hypothetical protein
MARKILYETFNRDKNVYNLNQGYWKRKLNLKLKKKFSPENILFKNQDSRNIKIYDGNPIFTYLDRDKNKAIRIIQDSLDDVASYDLDDINVLISAWIDKIDISIDKNNENQLDELVIALLLTKETVNLTMILILKWLESGLSDQNIQKIIQNSSSDS